MGPVGGAGGGLYGVSPPKTSESEKEESSGSRGLRSGDGDSPARAASSSVSSPSTSPTTRRSVPRCGVSVVGMLSGASTSTGLVSSRGGSMMPRCGVSMLRGHISNSSIGGLYPGAAQKQTTSSDIGSISGGAVVEMEDIDDEDSLVRGNPFVRDDPTRRNIRKKDFKGLRFTGVDEGNPVKDMARRVAKRKDKVKVKFSEEVTVIDLPADELSIDEGAALVLQRGIRTEKLKK
ncbi:hypothetical protein [Candidatus Ichthyocystis hellenicum]|uniref:hypothetical protein n=1 Tax=Candidatus Ichthyocystis hellenicum TaxID=1561003 RepID=UPI000B82BEE7|nr:hypothetical protein [Candidatus Ichthyocystis hellenicum]